MVRTINVLVCLVLAASFAGCGVRGSAEENYERGKELLSAGDARAAHRYFRAAARKADTNPDYHWAAARTSPDQNSAYLHTRDAWNNGARTPAVLASLVRLSFHTDREKKLEFALELFSQLPDSLRLEEFRSDLYCGHQAPDSCLAIRKRLFEQEPTPGLAVKIATAYSQSRQGEQAEAFLRQCRARRILDGEGYVVLAGMLAMEYDFTGVGELFAEARRYGLYTDAVKLEHGGFLIAQNRFDEAREVVRDMAVPAKGDQEGMRNLQARLMLALIYMSQRESDSLKALKLARYGEESWRKVEHELYDLMIARMGDTASILAPLRRVHGQLPRSPIVTLLLARELGREGLYDEAIQHYGELPAVVVRSPAVVTELATAYARSGKDDEALAVINVLHTRRVFTRGTLELFRDLTARKDLIDKSIAAQKLLEERYSGDAGIKFTGGVMALRSGDLARARKVFEELAAAHPAELRFTTLLVQTLLLQEKYDAALAVCDKSTAGPQAVAPLRARIYRRMGNTDAALAAYEKAVAGQTGAAVMFEYADFLVQNELHGKAAALYRDLDALQREQGGIADSAVQAMLQNNLAWSLMQQPGSDPRAVLAAAESAFRLRPQSEHILDTYADALIQYGRYRDCSRLLDKNEVAAVQPRLLYHLATAWDKQDDVNRAVRTYRLALETPVPAAGLELPVSRGSIEARIAELLAGGN